MLNVVHRSQIIDWIAIDSSTTNSFGELDEVWLDDSGRIAYFSGGETYLPVEGIAGVGMGAVSVYYPPLEYTRENLQRLHEITVESTLGEPLGWVENFLKEVSDEVAASTHHPHHALQEATEFLQEQWHSLQQSIARGGERAKASLDAAWKQIHQTKS